MKCKFCNGYGQIEITMYHKAITAWNYTERIELEKSLRIDCPECNESGKDGVIAKSPY